MNGAQALMASLVGAGVDVCFMNPGTSEGPRAARMLDLSGPTPDFTRISTGLGVPATRAATAAELDQALRRACAEPGPHLIEAIVPPVVPSPGTAW